MFAVPRDALECALVFGYALTQSSSGMRPRSPGRMALSCLTNNGTPAA
jgi:hypothetical protein